MIGCGESTQGRLSSSPVSNVVDLPISTSNPSSATGVAILPTPGAAPLTQSAGAPTNTVAPPPAPVVSSVQESVPEKLKDIVKLADAKVAPEVVLAVINRNEADYALTADEILLLRRRGLDEGVIAAMIRRPAEVAAAKVEQQLAAAPTPVQTNLPPAPEPAPVAVAQPAPQVVVQQPVQTVATVPTQTVVVQQPTQVVTVQYFQESLSPYGTWINVEGVGLCWQPSIVVSDSSWRPYFHGGRWIYSSAGWYWQSDYNWGWAAFHYGRWTRHVRHGWVWCPDTVWAPAWVSWRQSQDYFGWAPLPPGAHYRAGFGFTYHDRNVGISFGFGLGYDDFCFVPARRFCDPNPWRHGIGPRERQVIYNQTTVINNYVSGDNNVIINEGIGRTRIASATGQKLEPTPIRQLPAREHNGTRADSLADGGRAIAVYRPPQVENAPRQIAPSSGRSTMPDATASNPRSAYGTPASGRTTGGSDLRQNDPSGRQNTGQPVLRAQPTLAPQPMLERQPTVGREAAVTRSDLRRETPALTNPRMVESPTVPRQSVQLPPVSVTRQPHTQQPSIVTPSRGSTEPSQSGRTDYSPRSGRTEAPTTREYRQQIATPSPAAITAPTARTEAPITRYERPTAPVQSAPAPSITSREQAREQYNSITRQQPPSSPRFESTAPLSRAATIQNTPPPQPSQGRQIGAAVPAPQPAPDRGQSPGRPGRDRGN